MQAMDEQMGAAQQKISKLEVRKAFHLHLFCPKVVTGVRYQQYLMFSNLHF
jgi:hypothetical protein